MQKNVSEKVLAANRLNGPKGHGPVTKNGKRNSSLCALKHGFYAKELRVSDEDRPVFEALRESLETQLKPDTPMQAVYLENIIACFWRCKLALGLEMRALAAHFNSESSEFSEAKPGRDASGIRWYGASKADLRTAIRLLEEFQKDFASSGFLHSAEWQELLTKAFGSGFYDSLVEWKSMSIDSILMGQMLDAKTEKYEMKLPEVPKPEGIQVLMDPRQKFDMATKLIGLQLQHLRDFQQMQREVPQMLQQARQTLFLGTSQVRTATYNAASIGIFISRRKTCSTGDLKQKLTACAKRVWRRPFFGRYLTRPRDRRKPN